jgi:hypothetical protein
VVKNLENSIPKSTKSEIRYVVLFVLSFLIMAGCWIAVSPYGSGADDNYHLASIYCENDDLEVCKLDSSGLNALLPGSIKKIIVTNNVLERVTNDNVFEFSSHFNAQKSRPSIFYLAMSLLVSENVVESAYRLRAANALISSIVLFAALVVAPHRLKYLLMFSWGVAIIPVGVFSIASANPSSWAITAVGTFWVFCLASLRSIQKDKRKLRAARIGAVATFSMALGSRNEAALYCLFIFIALTISQYHHQNLKRTPKSRWFVVILPLVAAITLSINLLFVRFQEIFSNILQFDYLNQSPNPLINTFFELPRFFGNHFGGQLTWYQGNVNFFHGLGWLNFQLPSATGICITSAVVASLIMSINNFNRRSYLSTLFMWLLLIIFVFTSLALMQFSSSLALQARYTMPLLIAFIGITFYNSKDSLFFVNDMQSVLIAIMVWIGSVAAWQRTASFYSNGDAALWLDYNLEPAWWWQFGPAKIYWILFAYLAMFMWVYVAIVLSAKELNLKADAVPQKI